MKILNYKNAINMWLKMEENLDTFSKEEICEYFDYMQENLNSMKEELLKEKAIKELNDLEYNEKK